jgi:hypothetical protein
MRGGRRAPIPRLPDETWAAFPCIVAGVILPPRLWRIRRWAGLGLVASLVAVTSACTMTMGTSAPRMPGPEDRKVLVTVQDLAALVGEPRVFTAPKRFALERMEGGGRRVGYEYAPASGEVYMLCEAVSLPAGVSAEDYYNQTLGGFRFGVERNGSVSRAVAHRIDWGTDSRFLLLERGGRPYGNAFFAWRDNTAWQLVVTGVYFDEAWLFERLVERPLHNMLRWDPAGDGRAVVAVPGGVPEMGYFFYDVPGDEGTAKALVLAPVMEELGRGLPDSAVVGTWPPGANAGEQLSAEGFRPNPSFTGLLQAVLGRTVYDLEPLRQAALTASDGELLIVDLRSRARYGQAIEADVLGTVRVFRGEIVSGSYKANYNYSVLTADGLSVLPASVDRKLKQTVWELAWQ